MARRLVGWLAARWQPLLDLVMVAALGGLFAFSGTVVSVPLALGQLLPLAWRRRAPGVVLVVVGLATTVHMLIGMPRTIGYLPAVVAVHTAATSPSRLVRWGLCGGVTVAIACASQPHRGLVEGALLAAITCTVAWLFGIERARHLRERTRFAAERARLLGERLVAEDRERVARRVHDALAHSMTVMLVHAEALRANGQLRDDDRERVDLVLGAGRAALREVRGALADLETRAGPDLAARLDRLRSAGLVVGNAADTVVHVASGLPGPLREVLYRVVGEAATNALRHGGPATRLDVRIDRTEGTWVTITSRPGRWRRVGPPGGAGFGLRSLSEDVEAQGGTLTYGSSGRREWTVVAAFPERQQS